MNMLNRNCKMSFAKPEFLKKAQRANPHLYDIGCYNDNLALMLAPDSDEMIHLEKERRSKLSDLIRPFDYDQLNNLYDLFVPQREKSPEQHYFPKTSKMSHTSSNKEFSKESFCKQTTLLEKPTKMNSILGIKNVKALKNFSRLKRFRCALNYSKLGEADSLLVWGKLLKLLNQEYAARIRGKLIQKLLLNQKCMGYLVRAYYSISPTKYYKDDSCWSADLKSNTTEDVISI
ncbi:hypothetical protein Tco_0626826 [Tanacetum coccineum]|uniref:Uncharacterized protein n=1 Tax=Tanacetum coccineum TaxID=301880 RepID=A0ABQ4WKQ2_9ASTR